MAGSPVVVLDIGASKVVCVVGEAYDRGDKFAHYRTIPSLRAYLVLSQHRISAELYLRQPNGDWLLSTYDDMQHTVPLTALDVALPLAEIYDKVELTPRAEGMG